MLPIVLMSQSIISTTLIHKVRPPDGSSAGKAPLLIFLHGRGTNEDDLLGLADYLDPRFFIVSARAPFPFQQAPGSHTWYEVHEIGTPHPEQFAESYSRLRQFVHDMQTGYPVDPKNTFLFGFSMGSIMSFALGLTVPGVVRGIVAHSGYIPENAGLTFAWKSLQNLSVFIAHGSEDPVIPIEHGRRANELLSATAADVTYREYPILHTISEESLNDVSDWLQKRLDVRRDNR